MFLLFRRRREADFVIGEFKLAGGDQDVARSHEGNPPYYFRVELKCKMDHSKKSAFTRRLSSKIEKLSGRKLINTTSNYEFEIRLIENKEGNCNAD